MINKLVAVGKMFELAISPITKSEFKKLMELGRECKLYQDLRESNTSDIESFGFYLVDRKPTFEMYINGEPLNLEVTLRKDYEMIYEPVYGETKPSKGRETFYFITERGFKNGHSGLEFKGEFNKRKLTFRVERQGLQNGMVCSVVTPYYDLKPLDFYWNWSGFESDYILSSKGKVFQLERS